MAVQISGNDITVPRDTTVTRNLTVGGVLTYEDVTNVDSVGLVTARTGIEIGARPGVAASISVDGNMIVSGISTFNGDVKLDGGNLVLGDSGSSSDDRLVFGADSDLSIYHNGSNSYIDDSGTGNLFIRSNEVRINKYTNEYMIRAIADGAVELYHDNSKKFETASGGVSVTGGINLTTNLSLLDNGYLKLGTGDDLQLYHNGSHSYIDNSTGSLFVRSDTIKLRGKSVDEDFIEAFANGSVRLYYDNSQKLETTSSGVAVTGNVEPTGNINIPDSSSGSVGRARFGAGADLQIYHDGSNSNLANATGYLLVNSTGGDNVIRSNTNVYLQPASGESGVTAIANGAVELYYNNEKRLETKSNGIEMMGYMSVEANSGSVAQFVHESTADTVGIIMRHNRGALSGFNGKIISFRGYGNVERGSITIHQNSTVYSTTSDYRLKENIENITDGIERLKKLTPRKFSFKTSPSVRVDGFIAHEVEESGVVTECVIGTKDEVDEDNNPKYQGLDQSKLVPLLTAALQEAVTEIESLKSRLDAAGL